MLLLLVAACVPPALRFPPTPLHGADLAPTAPASVAFSGGLTGVIASEFGPDLFGGPVDAGVSVGLPAGFEVGSRFSGNFYGPTASVQVGWSPEGEGVRHGPVLGLSGGSYHFSGSYTDADEVVVEYDYRYWNLVPFLLYRVVVPLGDYVEIPFGLRGSWSTVAGLEGVNAPSRGHDVYWVEAVTGPTLRLDPVRIGLDLGYLNSISDTNEMGTGIFRLGMAVRGDLR